MRKNGFTLVEMLTVIIIMVVLSLIAVFSITGIVKSSTDKLYKLQIANIQDAARTYAVKNSAILSDNTEITICDLKRSSLLEDDLKDPKTDENFDDGLIIRIVKNQDGDFETIFDGTSKMENYNCKREISVVLNGSSPSYVRIDDEYEEQGISVKRDDLSCIRGSGTSDDTHCYYNFTKEGDYETALSNNKYNKVGTYRETYNVTVDTFRTSITRTIIVQDKTAPVITVRYDGTNHNNSFSVNVLEGTVANFSCTAVDGNVNIACVKQKDDYNSTTSPGTYEIIYTATDSYGNSSTLLVNIVVVAKNKNLIVGAKVNTTEWTNEPMTLQAFPLYSNYDCLYYYTFNGNSWNDVDTIPITENGEYRVGIKCVGGNEEDYMIYKVTNIDKEAPTFQGNTTVFASSTGGNIAEIVKNGKSHYYSNAPVSISLPSGAIDSGSGVAGYETYVNDVLFTDSILTGDGKYEIKVLAYDYANNKSEKVIAAYVVISNSKPICEFAICASSNCGAISGSYVAFSSGLYKLTTNDFSTPLAIDYKLTCSYDYYDEEESIFETTSLPSNKFYLAEESGRSIQMDINNVSISSSTTEFSNNKWTRTNTYVASLSVSSFSDIAYLYLRENALCDRIGNCNVSQVTSMPLFTR